MPKVEYRAKLADDRRSASLETLVDDGPVATAKLEPDQVSQLVGVFAALRSQLLEPIPNRPGTLPTPVNDPAIQVQRTPTGAIALNIRHPGYGWMAFELPPATAKQLTDWFRTG